MSYPQRLHHRSARIAHHRSSLNNREFVFYKVFVRTFDIIQRPLILSAIFIILSTSSPIVLLSLVLTKTASRSAHILHNRCSLNNRVFFFLPKFCPYFEFVQHPLILSTIFVILSTSSPFVLLSLVFPSLNYPPPGFILVLLFCS